MKMTIALIGALILSGGWVTAAHADGACYEIEVRANGLLGDGVPANDILGYGIAGRYYLRDGWFVAAALEDYGYDFERPIELVGLRQDPNVSVIDADGFNTVLSAHLGREQPLGAGRFQWFWTLGMGVGFADVDDVRGPTSTGGTFDLTFNADTEIHLMGAVGLSFDVTDNLALSATARAEHHFIDITITDRVSGMTGMVDAQSPLGAHFGASWRF